MKEKQWIIKNDESEKTTDYYKVLSIHRIYCKVLPVYRNYKTLSIRCIKESPSVSTFLISFSYFCSQCVKLCP